MATLIWQAPMRYLSPGDEAAFFSWLESIPGVLKVQGRGRQLHIGLRSKRLSATSLRELIALYSRYGGELWLFASLYVVALVWHLWARSRAKRDKQKDHHEGT